MASKTHNHKPKQSQSKWPKKCETKFCRNRVHKENRNRVCPKCQSRNFKAKFPLKYYFNKLKQRAIERGKEFKLTYAQYEEFCKTTGYDTDRGKCATSLSIDRKDNSKGYEVGNIQAIAMSDNSAKSDRKEYVPYFQRLREEAASSNQHDAYEEQGQEAPPQAPGCPF